MYRIFPLPAFLVDLLNFGTILQVIADCRHLVWQENFLEVSRLRTDGMTFIPAIRLHSAAPKQLENFLPQADSLIRETLPCLVRQENAVSASDVSFDGTGDIVYVTKLGYVGNSSFETPGMVLLPYVAQTNVSSSTRMSREYIAYSFCIYWVYLDRAQRNVASLPSWFCNSYVTDYHRNYIRSPRVDLLRNLPMSSANTLESSHMVTADMIDHHGHLNYSYYLQFITKLLQDARSETNSRCALHQLEIEYLGELTLGDSFKARVVTDTRGNVHAHVVKQQHDARSVIVMMLKLERSVNSISTLSSKL